MLTLSKTHPATLTIDDEPVKVNIVRMTKAQAIAFEREFFRHGQSRGSAEPTEDDKNAARQFVEDSITAYVTVDPDQIVDDGRPVVSGEDVIRTFCSRADVLTAFYQLVYASNFLGKVQKKILSEQPFSFPGSQRSIQGRNGELPEPIATSAESSSTAPTADATGSSDESKGESESSGAKVH